MLLQQEHIELFREAFSRMETREDLLVVMNEAKKIIYGEKAVPFELKQLTWYSNPAHFQNKVNQESTSADSLSVENMTLIRKPDSRFVYGNRRIFVRYEEFFIRKKSGDKRLISSPVKGLKLLQKALALVLQCVYEPQEAVMGFVPGKSIVDNARLHEGNKYVYNIDLKDFFGSIDQARVWKCLQLKPFNLSNGDSATQQKDPTLETGVRQFVTEFNEVIYYKISNNVLSLIVDKQGHYKTYYNRITSHLEKPVSNDSDRPHLLQWLKQQQEFRKKANEIVFEDARKYIFSADNVVKLRRLFSSRLSLANIIAALCCTEIEVERLNEHNDWVKVKRNVLPQGAPTSPIITNIVCQRLDFILTGVAKRFGLKYSRYADDITFSSMHNVYQPGSEFLLELHRVIKEQGFHIKESKTRLQKEGYRKEVTGLVVNATANVRKRYIKQLRMWLYYWERYGYDRAYSFFLQQYVSDKGHIKKGKPDMANVIQGKLDYLKMVKGNSRQYLELKKRYTYLTGKVVDSVDRSNYLNEVIDVFGNKGLVKAMQYYNPVK